MRRNNRWRTAGIVITLLTTGAVAGACGSSGGVFEDDDGTIDGGAGAAGEPGSGGNNTGGAGTGGAGTGGNGTGGAGGMGTGGAGTGGAAGAGTGGMAGVSGAGAAGGAAGAGGACSCDDGFDCTIDSCTGNGACFHRIGPNSGATACPTGEICELASGCVSAPICTSNAQCQTALGGDACKVNIQCNMASATCTFEQLDGDNDGYPPEVCGGGDCNDAVTPISPAANEVCDGVDNDCDGDTDEGALCAMGMCVAGVCRCDPAEQCAGQCVDKQSDPMHCGDCNTACPVGAVCVGGVCECPSSLTLCGNECVDTTSDARHCNGCNTACTGSRTCQSSSCQCGPGLMECGGSCVDTMTNASHCGGCNTPCGGSCSGGMCQACPDPALTILLDLSTSMDGTIGASTRFDVTRDGINAWLGLPATTGFSLGLMHFPITSTLTCMTNPDCGPGGLCFSGICIGGNGGDSCVVSEYAMLDEAITALPGALSGVQSTLAGYSTAGGTPMVPSLEGVLQATRSYVNNNSGTRAAVVLITDGTANTCTPGTTAGVVTVASQFAGTTPQIPTYVLGIEMDNLSDWNQIAAGGGTTAARTAGSVAQVSSALAQIQAEFTACP